MENNNKFYLFATVVRSFDVYHVRNNIIHLLFNFLYTTVDLVPNLKNIPTTQNHPYLIIRILFRWDDFSQVISHNKLVVEYQCSLSHLFKFEGIYGFNCFIDQIIGDYYLDNNNELKFLNNVLFVFEEIN